MTPRDAIVIALRALIVRILTNQSVLDDAMKQVEGLAEIGGNGRLIIVIDFEHGRRGWCQVLPIIRLGVRHSIDIAEIQ